MTTAAFSTPEAAEAAFYAAFAATNLGGMAMVWHAGDNARCIHPGGDVLRGAGAVLESWRQIFAGAAAPTVRHRLLHRTTAAEVSIHLVEERIGPAAADTSGLTRVLATNVYARTGDGWRMVLHHATLPLVEDREQADAGHGNQAAPGGRLH
ncbi:MAG: nuclear transport factor 2 family protein [Thiohalocapsa sp.]|jgi:ketosteroid isomerase-like protein